jgi:leader peptidase (prepilin peptidase)/N-methyltransferase
MGVELLTGCIFAALGWRFGAIGITPGLLLYAAFCSLMIIATFTDIDHFIIPDGISVGGGIAMIIATGLVSLAVFADLPTGLIAPIANGWPFDQEQVVQNFGALTPFLMALIGGLFGAGMLWGVGVIGKILFRKEAMGMGDVKLMIGIGAILGWFHTLVSFFLACVLGAVISLVVIAIQKMRGPVNQTVGEQFPALGGAIESAKQSALSAEQSDLESESEVIGEESEKDGTLFNQIGQQFAEESRKRAPYALKHLPFGPYLAVAAIITLFAHHLISRDANRTLYLLELRDRPPFVINYDTTPSQSLRYTP